MGGKVSGGRRRKRNLARRREGKVMSEREPDNGLPPSDKAAGQNVMEGSIGRAISRQ